MRQTLRRFGLFWVDFVLGDDWTLAAVVVVALLVTWGLSHTGFPGWVAIVVIVLAALVGSVARARRSAGRGRDAD
jgi:Flp pilus assembly protein TadB